MDKVAAEIEPEEELFVKFINERFFQELHGAYFLPEHVIPYFASSNFYNQNCSNQGSFLILSLASFRSVVALEILRFFLFLTIKRLPWLELLQIELMKKCEDTKGVNIF